MPQKTPRTMKPDLVQLWRPRGDEHKLAASLGLCEEDPELLRQLVTAAQEQVARDLPGTRVRINRWHVWRVVRAMHRAGQTNTPAGRAAAFGWITDHAETETENDDA